MINGKTILLALIGQPVSHSLSPAMHNAAFAADGLDFVYVCLDVDPDALPDAVKGAIALKLRGFNVTMPHKRAMIPLVDELDEGARISGAVNTVVIEGSTLRGYNTDGGGMVMACEEAGIAVAFSGVGVGELHIANRSLEHAIELRDKLRRVGIQKAEAHTLDALEEPITEAAVVVNATPLGMKEGDALPILAGYVGGGRAICDAVYLPGTETPLVRLARERGARVAAGDRMLLYQGVLAQKLWTGRKPNVKVMDRTIS